MCGGVATEAPNKGIQAFEELCKFLNALMGCIDHDGLAFDVYFAVLHLGILPHTVFNDLAFFIRNELGRNPA